MVSSLSSAASVFARVDARKLERKQKNRRSGNACYAGYTGYVIAFVRSCGVTTRAFAWIFREFDVWAQVKLLFCSLMHEVCFCRQFWPLLETVGFRTAQRSSTSGKILLLISFSINAENIALMRRDLFKTLSRFVDQVCSPKVTSNRLFAWLDHLINFR